MQAVQPYLIFFEIRNNDTKAHEVTVEVLDSHNSSIFKESYRLHPNETIYEAKPSSLLHSVNMKEYTFRTTLDNGTEEANVSIPLHRWSTAIIVIDWENRYPITTMVKIETGRDRNGFRR
ncbi:hypothetical protein [Methanosarcina horonobensis]|uniref:hypothetical protein n=1 Tax=Methanosarcina horonobensis TaxID=418008 RepID=UPI000B1ED3FC|nr:hypothetical protein [Methanosarcina horonobensis]